MKSSQTDRLDNPIKKLQLILDIFNCVEIGVKSYQTPVKHAQTIFWIHDIYDLF